MRFEAKETFSEEVIFEPRPRRNWLGECSEEEHFRRREELAQVAGGGLRDGEYARPAHSGRLGRGTEGRALEGQSRWPQG